MMKLHRLAETYSGSHHVMTWCGRLVWHDDVVKPEDVGTERECKTCAKAHDSAVRRYPEEARVSATR